MSVAAALAYRWDGKRCGLLFQLRAGSYDTESPIDFLKQMKRHLRGKPVILVWDRLPSHKSRRMLEYLHSQRHWLRVEWLPAYAPELNPVETLWSNLKGQELANHCAEELAEAVSALDTEMARIGRCYQLSFLDHAGLFYDHLCNCIIRDSVIEGTPVIKAFVVGHRARDKMQMVRKILCVTTFNQLVRTANKRLFKLRIPGEGEQGSGVKPNSIPG